MEFRISPYELGAERGYKLSYRDISDVEWQDVLSPYRKPYDTNVTMEPQLFGSPESAKTAAKKLKRSRDFTSQGEEFFTL